VTKIGSATVRVNEALGEILNFLARKKNVFEWCLGTTSSEREKNNIEVLMSNARFQIWEQFYKK